MTWQADLSISNNTQYRITVTANSRGDLAQIDPGAKWSWSTTEVNNTLSLKFSQTPNVWYMQGSVAFGPEAGVYMDRGWQAADDQSIRLHGTVNSTVYDQTANGGATVVPWDGFESGGAIQMTFSPQ